MNGRVLVTDSRMRSALAVIRSLGKNGLRVTAAEDSRITSGSLSRYCTDRIVYPSPSKSPQEFINFILNVVQETKYDAIIPVGDAPLWPIISHMDDLSKHTKVALPKMEIFLRAYDKLNTIKIAMANGVPCPTTVELTNESDLKEAFEKLGKPVVIKPRVSSGSRGLGVYHELEMAEADFSTKKNAYGNLIAQEFIPKDYEFGIYAAMDKTSEPVALSAQRRLRSYPVKGGPSTLRESFRNPITEMATRLSFKLLQEMKWVGVAMVEFRVDARSGVPKLMEVNPRFWGSLNLSLLAGVDFPFIQFQIATGHSVIPNLNYEAGVKSRWLLPGDMLWYLSSPHKWRHMKDLLDFHVPDDIISSHDPLPTIGFLFDASKGMFKEETRRMVFR